MESILSSKLLLNWQDVKDSFQLVWVRVPYKLISNSPSISTWIKWEKDIVMEWESIVDWLSYGFISNEEWLLKAKSDFIDRVYTTVPELHPDTDKAIISDIESWNTIAKVDYDNDVFQAMLIKWWADEEKQTVYALIQRKSIRQSDWNKVWFSWKGQYEILPESITNVAYKIEEDISAVKFERTIADPSIQKINAVDKQTFDWLVKAADDDFKC